MRITVTGLQGLLGCLLIVGGQNVTQAQVALPPTGAVSGMAPAVHTASQPPQLTIPVPSYDPSPPSLFQPPRLSESGAVRPVSFDYYAQAEGEVPPLPPSVSPDQIPSSRETPFQITPQTPPASDSQTTYSGNPPVQD